jgi:hypothetical protein
LPRPCLVGQTTAEGGREGGRRDDFHHPPDQAPAAAIALAASAAALAAYPADEHTYKTSVRITHGTGTRSAPFHELKIDSSIPCQPAPPRAARAGIAAVSVRACREVIRIPVQAPNANARPPTPPRPSSGIAGWPPCRPCARRDASHLQRPRELRRRARQGRGRARGRRAHRLAVGH